MMMTASNTPISTPSSKAFVATIPNNCPENASCSILRRSYHKKMKLISKVYKLAHSPGVNSLVELADERTIYGDIQEHLPPLYDMTLSKISNLPSAVSSVRNVFIAYEYISDSVLVFMQIKDKLSRKCFSSTPQTIALQKDIHL